MLQAKGLLTSNEQSPVSPVRSKNSKIITIEIKSAILQESGHI